MFTKLSAFSQQTGVTKIVDYIRRVCDIVVVTTTLN